MKRPPTPTTGTLITHTTAGPHIIIGGTTTLTLGLGRGIRPFALDITGTTTIAEPTITGATTTAIRITAAHMLTMELPIAPTTMVAMAVTQTTAPTQFAALLATKVTTPINPPLGRLRGGIPRPVPRLLAATRPTAHPVPLARRELTAHPVPLARHELTAHPAPLARHELTALPVPLARHELTALQGLAVPAVPVHDPPAIAEDLAVVGARRPIAEDTVEVDGRRLIAEDTVEVGGQRLMAEAALPADVALAAFLVGMAEAAALAEATEVAASAGEDMAAAIVDE